MNKVFECPSCHKEMLDDAIICPDDIGYFSCEECHILYDDIFKKFWVNDKIFYGSLKDINKVIKLKYFI